MAKKNYFEKFAQWQNYAHYVMLALLLTTYYYYLGDFTKTPFDMLIELIGLLFVSDSIVHAIFYFAPKPIQWRD